MGDGYDDYERLATRPADYEREKAIKAQHRAQEAANPKLRARLNKPKGLIEIRGWLGEATPALYREVGGGTFLREPNSHWRFPLDLATCRKLAEVFGDRIEFNESLKNWMDREGEGDA